MEIIADRAYQRFETEEYQSRVAGFKGRLAQRGVDVYLGSSPEQMNYLSGFDPLGLYFFQKLVLPVDADEPVLLTHKCEAELARTTCWIQDIRIWTHGEDPVARTISLLKEVGVMDGSIVGLDMDNWYLKAATVDQLRSALPGTNFVDVTDIGLEQRMVKSPAEISYMREAAELADLAFRVAVETIRPGVREVDVLAAIQNALTQAGCEYPALPFIIGAGPRSGLFHPLPTENVIHRGDAVMLELTGVRARYNSNIVRTVVTGEATAELRELQVIVKESFDRGLEAIRPGEPVGEVDRIARAVRQDYEEFIPSRCGFGMELAYPPVWLGRPDLLEGDPHVFEPGMVVSLEPSIAQYRGVTMIFGKNILVTQSGHEVLHSSPDDIFELPLIS